MMKMKEILTLSITWCDVRRTNKRRD